MLVASVTALEIGIPILKTYFDGNGYEQSATILVKAVTKDGWTLTLTDCVGDDRYLYLGIEVTAHKGTVLDEETYRVEGDALKEHHEWVSKDAQDGWYSCNEQPTITLYDKARNVLEPDAQSVPFGIRAGSGCWGGTNSDEPGKLKIV